MRLINVRKIAAVAFAATAAASSEKDHHHEHRPFGDDGPNVITGCSAHALRGNHKKLHQRSNDSLFHLFALVSVGVGVPSMVSMHEASANMVLQQRQQELASISAAITDFAQNSCQYDIESRKQLFIEASDHHNFCTARRCPSETALKKVGEIAGGLPGGDRLAQAARKTKKAGSKDFLKELYHGLEEIHPTCNSNPSSRPIPTEPSTTLAGAGVEAAVDDADSTATSLLGYEPVDANCTQELPSGYAAPASPFEAVSACASNSRSDTCGGVQLASGDLMGNNSSVSTTIVGANDVLDKKV